MRSTETISGDGSDSAWVDLVGDYTVFYDFYEDCEYDSDSGYGMGRFPSSYGPDGGRFDVSDLDEDAYRISVDATPLDAYLDESDCAWQFEFVPD